MPFTLTWTEPNGSKRLEVATAANALRESVMRQGSVVKLVVRDNHGREIDPDDLMILTELSENS
jgi:hypothetical protein